MTKKYLKVTTSILAGVIVFSAVLLNVFGSVVGHDVNADEQDDPIKVRQANMHTISEASKTLGQMVRGRIDYDASAAQEAMTNIRDAMIEFVQNFPEGTEEGKTEASPKIWLDMEGFIAASQKMEMDADEAIAAAGESLDSLKASFGIVASNCKSCHQDYREKKF